MKRILMFLLAAVMVFSLTSCVFNLTDRDSVIRLYERNEERFAAAAETGDFEKLEKIIGVQEVDIREDGDSFQAEISCGANGFASSTHYYGIFYSETVDFDNSVATKPEEWTKEGAGYRYTEAEGDNTFYYEPLGGGYYYFEEHY